MPVSHCYSGTPPGGIAPDPDADRVVLQLRLRVAWKNLDAYLGLYDQKFLPVDKAAGREVLRLFHDTRHHFNLTFLYRYRDWDHWHGFYGDLIAAWTSVHGGSTQDAKQAIQATEAKLNALIEDDERLILSQLPGIGFHPGK